MNKDKQSTQNTPMRPLVPRLRFPEFAEAGEWERKKICDLCSYKLTNGVFNDPQKQGGKYLLINVIDMYLDTTIQDSHLKTVDLETNDFKNNKVEYGDIFFTRSSLVKEGIACSNIYLGKLSNVTFDGHLIRFRLNTSILLYMFAHFVLKTSTVRSQLIACGKTATMTTIGQDDVKNIILPFPSKPEQQRIADCLMSLDENITAQSHKLDTLKAHKKGLMQKLFPAEGERVPELRFPEFAGDGEWEKIDLGSNTIKVGSGITPRGGEKNYIKTGRPFVRSQNISWGKLLLEDVAFIDETTHNSFSSTEIKYYDVLLNITGASIGRCALADFRIEGGNVNQHVCIIRTEKNELLPDFLCQYILSEFGQKQIDSFQAGGNRQGLNFEQVKSFEIPIPYAHGKKPREQQHIADCLTSLDELITAQTRKMELLKEHKKGLMQQLFPCRDEAQA